MRSARSLLGIVCVATFWVTGRFSGEFYPFSPLGMFNRPATAASRLFVRDASGAAKEVARYEGFRCECPLEFGPARAPACPASEYSAYDQIVRDYIVSHPAAGDDAGPRESIQITRRVFRVPVATGPVVITDCPLLRCTAHPRSPSRWNPRL